jgi:hypothetical protein
MTRFNKATPGQDLNIPAATWNELVNMLIWWRGQGPASRQPIPRVRELDTIRLRNDSGEDLDAFRVLGLDEPLFTPEDDEDDFKFRWRMKGVMPERAAHYRRFAVLLEPAPEDAIVEAAVDGVVCTLLDVVDEHHTHADVVDDETLLRTDVCGGAKILWKEDGVGEKWALVQLGAPLRTAFAKADGPIDGIDGEEPGSGTVTEWVWNEAGTELVESELQFDGYNAGEDEAPEDKILQLQEIGDRMVIAARGGGGGATIKKSTLSADCAIGAATCTVADEEDPLANPGGYGGASGTTVFYTDIQGELTVIGMGIVSVDLVKNVADVGSEVDQTKLTFGGYAVSTEGTATKLWDWGDCEEGE